MKLRRPHLPASRSATRSALLLIPALLLLGSVSFGQQAKQRAQKQTIRGNQTIRLNQHLGLDKSSNNRVIDQVFLDVDRVSATTQADLLIAGIPLVSRRIERNTRGRIPLTLPFRILYEPTLAIDLRINGNLSLQNIGLGFEGDQIANQQNPGTITKPPINPNQPNQPNQPTRPVTQVPANPVPVQQATHTLEARRFATRGRTTYYEQPAACGRISAGALDGWDFPQYGCKLDGHVAIYRPGNKTTSLCLEFDDLTRLPYNRIVGLKLEAKIYGSRGKAVISFAGQPFKDLVAKSIDVPAVPNKTLSIDLGPLIVDRANISQAEICIRSMTDTQLNVDGARLIVTVE